MGTKYSAICGNLVALVTPMTSDGGIDWDIFRKLIDWHIERALMGWSLWDRPERLQRSRPTTISS